MMPEILTESFCERCGTRYTFESSAPRKTRRLGQFKTLSKGLKNYVLSDDTSMDEAMAAARSDDERETTAQQLDAFHATFNFCMNCRQYTCGNCWNQTEGRCLTCSPTLGRDILEAPFPDQTPFEPFAITAEAWPTTDLLPAEPVTPAYGGNASNGVAPQEAAIEASNGAVQEHEAAEEDDAGATFSFLRLDRGLPEAPADATAATLQSEADVEAGPIAEPTEPIVADVAASDDVWPEPIAPAAHLAPMREELEDRASTLASNTANLFGRFRPGQNIDAELAAFEAGLESSEADEAEAAPEPIAAAAWPEPEPEPEPIAAAAWPEPEPDIVAAGWPEAEPVAAEPFIAEPEFVATEPEPLIAEPEPVAAEAEPVAAEPEPEPVAAEPVRTDRIEQPTWRVFAPDQIAPAGGQPVETPVSPAAPPSANVPPTVEPQWPVSPEVQNSPSMALLANRTRSSSDALWAASSQEVLSPVATGPAVPTTTVQPCSSCGLSLSATARFCRRCGTRQG
jgi:hypothetical protein